ncbi:MAG: Trp family transcriptional regulator [Candidatus Gracilibacteria bacterium]
MQKNYLKELAKAVVAIKDPVTAEEFLQNILTPKELEEVAKRLQIFKLLYKGMPQRKIAEELNVSIGTIGHGSRELQYGKKAIQKILAKGW